MTLSEKLLQVKREHPELAETMDEAIEVVKFPFRRFCMQEARYRLEEVMLYPDPEEETVNVIANRLMESESFASGEVSESIVQEYIEDTFSEIKLFVEESYSELVFLTEKNKVKETEKRLHELFHNIRRVWKSETVEPFDTWKIKFLDAVDRSSIRAIYKNEETCVKMGHFGVVSGRIKDVVDFFVDPVAECEIGNTELSSKALANFIDFRCMDIKGGDTVYTMFYHPQPETDFVVFSCFKQGGMKTLKIIQAGMPKWKMYKMIKETITEMIGDPGAIIRACKCQQ